MKYFVETACCLMSAIFFLTFADAKASDAEIELKCERQIIDGEKSCRNNCDREPLSLALSIDDLDFEFTRGYSLLGADTWGGLSREFSYSIFYKFMLTRATDGTLWIETKIKDGIQDGDKTKGYTSVSVPAVQGQKFILKHLFSLKPKYKATHLLSCEIST